MSTENAEKAKIEVKKDGEVSHILHQRGGSVNERFFSKDRFAPNARSALLHKLLQSN